MSKADFIDNVARWRDLSPAEAKRVVELVFREIENGLKRAKKEGKYTIGTFGAFAITKRGARQARNPRAGDAIKIKASKSLRFRSASGLKSAPGC